MFRNEKLQKYLETSSSIKSQPAVIAEWNLNFADNISVVGNYRYRPTAQPNSDDSVFSNIANSFDINDADNEIKFYTGATDADVVVDGGLDNNDQPIAFVQTNEKERLLYSLEDCFYPFRPRSGINKLRYFENNYTHHTNPSMAKRPRYYMPSRDDSFKYWTSYRLEEGTERGIANKQIGAQYFIDDAAPFVVYKEEIPVNKIVVKMQTHVGEEDLGPFSNESEIFDDPFFGENNKATPTNWRIQYLDGNDWVDAFVFDQSTVREDNTPPIGPDGYVEVSYGIVIPQEYKSIFSFVGYYSSSSLLPESPMVGSGYLVGASNQSAGEMFVWDGEEYRSFIPQYGWFLSNEEINDQTSFVTETSSPSKFLNQSTGKEQYREIQYIRGIRVVVETMNKQNSTFDLIEISPRLTVDLTEKLKDFSVDKSASDLGVSGMPVGQLLAANGSLSLFDYDETFNPNNPESILGKYLKNNVQIKLYEVIYTIENNSSSLQESMYYVPIKFMYVDSFPEISSVDRDISLSLRDFFFHFENFDAPQILVESASLSYAISLLLDHIGFSNYVFLRTDEEDDPIIPYFFVQPDQTVAQILEYLAISTQSAMFFDEYNNFVVMSKNYIMPTEEQRETDIELSGSLDQTKDGLLENKGIKEKLSNIIDMSFSENKIYNDGTISYTNRHIQKTYGSLRQASLIDKEKTWIYRPVLLWEAGGEEFVRARDEESTSSSFALSAIPLNADLTDDVPFVVNNEIQNNVIDFGEGIYWLGRYNGYLYANGEIIKFDAVEYSVSGFGDVWISSVKEYQNYFSKVPFNGKIYPTGKVKIYAEPDFEEIDGITLLSNGSVAKHGRGQFGTTIVNHPAGLDPYWTDTSNNAAVGGVEMDSSYLFSQNIDVKLLSVFNEGENRGRVIINILEDEEDEANGEILFQTTSPHNLVPLDYVRFKTDGLLPFEDKRYYVTPTRISATTFTVSETIEGARSGEVIKEKSDEMFNASPGSIFATGGITEDVVVEDIKYRIHVFDESGTFSVTDAPEGATIEYLIVGGGGAGGRGDNGQGGGGGGGAGGVISGSTTIGVQNYNIVIGAGGSGASATKGGSSSAFGVTAEGGGRGTGDNTQEQGSAINGASGGGGFRTLPGGTGISGQGFAGGNGGTDIVIGGAGGGGAGGIGASNLENNAQGRDGGLAVKSEIVGSEAWFAGGGGGGGHQTSGGLGGGTSNSFEKGGAGNGGARNSNGFSAAPNSGSGGGGGSGGDGTHRPGGDGGSGVVVIRYAIGGGKNSVLLDTVPDTAIISETTNLNDKLLIRSEAEHNLLPGDRIFFMVSKDDTFVNKRLPGGLIRYAPYWIQEVIDPTSFVVSDSPEGNPEPYRDILGEISENEKFVFSRNITQEVLLSNVFVPNINNIKIGSLAQVGLGPAELGGETRVLATRTPFSQKVVVESIQMGNPGVFVSENHKLFSGDLVRLSTTGKLPDGVFPEQDYFVEKIDENSFSLFTVFLQDVEILDEDQSGTHTFSKNLNYSNTITLSSPAISPFLKNESPSFGPDTEIGADPQNISFRNRIDIFDRPLITNTGKAGVSEDNADLARSSSRNGIIKNFLSNTSFSETEINRFLATQAGTIQSSALVMTGPSFSTELEDQEKRPIDFVSYVYKELDNKFTHFGTRLRIIGKLENEESIQNAFNSINYYQSLNEDPDDILSFSGGSAGLAVMLNPETNMGYYFEIIALTDSNVESYGGEDGLYNVLFYKVARRAPGEAEPPVDDSSKAIPARLWGSATSILVDDGTLAGQFRMINEQDPSVYDLAVEYEDIDDNKRRFYLYFNNRVIAVVDDNNPLPVYNNMALFVRGEARAMFENIYAISNNYSQNTVAPLETPINSVFGTNQINVSESFRKYAISGLVQSTYLSGIGTNDTPKYNIYFDEFGTIMREASYLNVRYDKAYPALYAQITPTFNKIKSYTVSGFVPHAYGAEFLVFNHTDTAISLDETSGNYLRIQGVSFTQEAERELTVDDYFENISNFSNFKFSEDGTIRSPVRNKKEYQEIKKSRLTNGISSFNLSAPYIQTQDDASDLMGWIISKTSSPRKSVGLRVFGLPIIQLGDIVTLDYVSPKGNEQISTSNSRFVVYNISYSRSSIGPSMEIFLSEVK